MTPSRIPMRAGSQSKTVSMIEEPIPTAGVPKVTEMDILDSLLEKGQLDSSQKLETMGEGPKEPALHGLVEPSMLGKVMVSGMNQKPICPTCGNPFLALYQQGTWRCNLCGDTSAKH
jgi:ribosomal protein S27AE